MPRKHKKAKKSKNKTLEEPCEDSRFAFIAGFTEGGAPYGVTWEELAKTEKQELKGSEANLLMEITHIVNRAAARDTRVISWGFLIFFSTESGDAWALDPEDNLAICLARDGSRRSVKVFETESNYGIQWEATYDIDGEIFNLIDKSGRIISILGYPTKHIQHLINLMNDETLPF